MQTCIHLKNGKVCSTLRATPLHHNELIVWCDMHLVYMGFGIFLCLVQRPIIVPDANVLGMIHSNDPATLQKFIAASQGVTLPNHNPQQHQL